MENDERISLNSELAMNQITKEEYKLVNQRVDEIVIMTFDILEIIDSKGFLPGNNVIIIDSYNRFLGLLKLLPNKDNLILKSDLFVVNSTLIKVFDIVTEEKRKLFELAEDGIYETTNAITLINGKRHYSRQIIKSYMSNDVKILIEHINVQLESLIDLDRTKHLKIDRQKVIAITAVGTKHLIAFAELFKPEYSKSLNVLFERLQINGYTDENNHWIIKTDINEPAKLFYYLKDKNVIIAPKITPSIKCFYIEFGCEVVEKVNGNPRATTRRNTESAKFSVDESEYKFLLSWIDKK